MKRVYAGDYHQTSKYGLIKIGVRGINPKTNKMMVVFCPVKTGGMVEDPIIMDEDELINIISQ